MFAKQFFNRNRVFGIAVLAATLASAGAAHAQSRPGSTEATTDEVVQIMSAHTGVSNSDITIAIRSASDDTVVVLASAPQHAGFDRVCRFDMTKDSEENDIGWAIIDQACAFCQNAQPGCTPAAVRQSLTLTRSGLASSPFPFGCSGQCSCEPLPELPLQGLFPPYRHPLWRFPMKIQHGAPLLIAAQMFPAWSYDQETLAAREGWQISECTGSDNGPWQVANFASPEDHREAFGFLPPYLDGDADAMRLVVNGKAEHHLAAREFLRAHNPMEYAAIMKMVDSTRENAANRRLKSLLRYGSRTLKNAVARAGGLAPSVALAQARKPTPEADANLSRKKLFALGRDVSYALPVGVSVLRPSREGLQAAAKKMGITYAQAQRALGVFNSAG